LNQRASLRHTHTLDYWTEKATRCISFYPQRAQYESDLAGNSLAYDYQLFHFTFNIRFRPTCAPMHLPPPDGHTPSPQKQNRGVFSLSEPSFRSSSSYSFNHIATGQHKNRPLRLMHPPGKYNHLNRRFIFSRIPLRPRTMSHRSANQSSARAALCGRPCANDSH
jgi:hypothetical protein